MTIKTKRKNGVLFITLEQKVDGKLYAKTYTCSFDKAEADFKEYIKSLS